MAQERVERRLAAILVADVVGYSRLVGQDEEGTIARLNALRGELIDPSIARHGGRIVKTMGDGVLVEFPSVVDAVRSAVEVQKEMAERNAHVPEDRCIEFRVGVNLGDIVVQADDILGDGVNVAARLEGLAEPGGVCISSAAFDQIESKLDLAFEDLGAKQVKNIAKPVRVYRLRLTAIDLAAPGGAKAPELPDKPSIAVLPFDNMSGDPEQEYFSDGITEDIITALSRVRQFFVIARNTTFTYKGQAVDVQAVAKDLGVRYVLEGSVRNAGNRVRISAQLIDGDTGNHIWAERYDRELEDIFAVQDEITQTVVGAIEPELGRAEQDRALQKAPESLDAWDHLQRGWWYISKFERTQIDEALRNYELALEAEPNFGRAHSAVAFANCVQHILASWSTGGDWLEAGRNSAIRATELDDQDAFAHAILGLSFVLNGQHSLATQELQRSIELNPSFATAHHWLGLCYALERRPEEAISQQDMATRLSPNDPLMWGIMNVRAIAKFNMQEFEEAAMWSTKATLQPNCPLNGRIIHLACLARLDRMDECQEVLDTVLKIEPDVAVESFRNVYPYKHDEDADPWIDSLRKAGLPE